jgi:hypothetical protein
MRTQPPRWLAVCVRGLLYTHPDLTIIPTTDGLTTWRVVLVQDGRWEFEVDAVASATPHTSRGSIYTVEEPSCRGRPEDAFNYKYKGGIGDLFLGWRSGEVLSCP